MTDDADSITVHSDYICPFCYLGRMSLEQYQSTRADPLAVEWHPFDLRADQRGPDGETDDDAPSGKDDAYFERAGEKVKRLQEEYGVEMAETLVRDVDSRNAQLASVHVQMDHPEVWDAFDWAIFDALWQEGRDVSDPAVLSALADEVGLDPDEIRAALDDELVERRLVDQWEAARLKGISGVPTFVYGEHTARGAVPPEHFERLIGGETR